MEGGGLQKSFSRIEPYIFIYTHTKAIFTGCQFTVNALKSFCEFKEPGPREISPICTLCTLPICTLCTLPIGKHQLQTLPTVGGESVEANQRLRTHTKRNLFY